MRIGVFDSGLGGIWILEAIRAQLPEYDYLYYGDTVNLPYGDKSEETIIALTRTAIEELFKKDVTLVIVACNTASVETVRKLQDTMLIGEYRDHRILGVIVPTIEELLLSTRQRALLIGTKRTVESKKYERELLNRGGAHIELTSVATPDLVPLIEADDLEGAYSSLSKLLTPKIGEIDTLVLGCTHYTILKEGLRSRFPTLKIISQDELIPESLQKYLLMHPEIQERLTTGSTCAYQITGNEPMYLNRVRE